MLVLYLFKLKIFFFKCVPLQIEIGTVPIPKSVTASRIRENIDVFNFQLTSDEISIIDGFNKNERVIGYTESRGHKYYPFDDEL